MVAGRRLQPSLKEEFQRPVGRDIDVTELRHIDANMIIAVGDVVSLTIRENGIVPLLSVYDGYTKKREFTGFADFVRNEGMAEIDVSNPAGTITSALKDAVRDALVGRSGGFIRVEGEEDLALLPCVLYAPDGAVVVYGWPGRGMKAVDTDASSRKWARDTMSRMEELT